jgi:hypothetical protein
MNPIYEVARRFLACRNLAISHGISTGRQRKKAKLMPTSPSRARAPLSIGGKRYARSVRSERDRDPCRSSKWVSKLMPFGPIETEMKPTNCSLPAVRKGV